jgi:hypothetical protein
MLVKIGHTGIMSKSFTKYVNASGLPGNQGTTETSHVGHCTRDSKNTGLNKHKTFNVGSNITCRTAVTLYTPETRFVSGILF